MGAPLELTPRDIRLTSRTWQAAAVLAGLRVAVNDEQRQPDRDSGPTKNALNDLVGALTELVALRVLEQLGADNLSHQLLDLYQPCDGVDLQGSYRGRPFRLEVKGHFQQPSKHYLLINERAQRNSRRRGADGHLPIVTTLLHGAARVGRVVPIDDLERPPWGPPRRFGVRHDPAWSLGLSTLQRVYLGGVLVPPAPQVALDPDGLQKAGDRGRHSLPRLRRDRFNLAGLSAEAIVCRLSAV
jgi:hypothetical protein